MKFKYTIMYVPDVAKTLAFYEQAFGLEQAFLHESGDYGELSTGNTKLAFSSLALMTSLGKHPSSGNPASPNFEIAFETDDVAGNLAKALEAGAELVEDVSEMPWGQTISYVRDLNGYLVEICSPVAGL
ncbi:VOC family protein [Enterovibrio paralichthyis]|uniref:VOC family protein n=1 Tax=Enterovibrio paralichthyis TaxID=2853805 RepID=UPI001C46A737|nr:VOC family protein [Enterovibrio paralichthyis]MBV7297481.1 VOC family protein [Enterovibrio paralichthyis]